MKFIWQKKNINNCLTKCSFQYIVCRDLMRFAEKLDQYLSHSSWLYYSTVYMLMNYRFLSEEFLLLINQLQFF